MPPGLLDESGGASRIIYLTSAARRWRWRPSSTVPAALYEPQTPPQGGGRASVSAAPRRSSVPGDPMTPCILWSAGEPRSGHFSEIGENGGFVCRSYVCVSTLGSCDLHATLHAAESEDAAAAHRAVSAAAAVVASLSSPCRGSALARAAKLCSGSLRRCDMVPYRSAYWCCMSTDVPAGGSLAAATRLEAQTSLLTNSVSVMRLSRSLSSSDALHRCGGRG